MSVTPETLRERLREILCTPSGITIMSPEFADMSCSCSCSSKGIAGREMLPESQPFKKAMAVSIIETAACEEWKFLGWLNCLMFAFFSVNLS